MRTPRGIAPVALGIAALVLLASCSMSPSTPDAAPSTVASDPATPAPTQTPSVAPTPTTQAKPTLDQLVVSPDGLGPILIGKTVTSQPDAAAVVTWNATLCSKPAGAQYAGGWVPNYPTVKTIFQPSIFPFTFASAKKTSPVTFILVWSKDLRTAAGIGVGSTVADITSAYGSVDQVVHAATTDLYVIKGSRGQLVIEVASKYEKGLSSWSKSAVGTVQWMQIATSSKPVSIANSDVGGSCVA